MKSPRLTIWLLSSLCTFAGASCTNNAEPAPSEAGTIAVSYAQTQCADKWGTAPSTQQLETVATAYLAKQGIALANAHASQTGIVSTCLACTCKTGVVLEGKVSAAQLAAIQALGFQKI